MKNTLIILLICILPTCAFSQVVITNSNFSLGTTGRIGVGMSPNGEGTQWKPLNLSGQGSLAGRMERTELYGLVTGYSLYAKTEWNRQYQCHFSGAIGDVFG